MLRKAFQVKLKDSSSKNTLRVDGASSPAQLVTRSPGCPCDDPSGVARGGVIRYMDVDANFVSSQISVVSPPIETWNDAFSVFFEI